MQTLKDPSPKPTSMGPILAAAFGCLGLFLLGVLVLIVIGGIAYFQGNSLPPVFSSATPYQTNTPIATLVLTATPTFTASPTFAATQTPPISPTPTATIIFHPPTLAPTRTRTPVPKPTRTRTPTSTSTPVTTIINDTQYNFKFNTWGGITSKQAIGKGIRCSSTKNELLSFDTVKGVNFLSLFFYRGPNQGKARILVDGVPVETLDLFRVSPQYRYEWKYIIPKPSEAHKVKILILREKQYASVGYQVCFDGYRFDTAIADDINYGIRFGTWAGVLNGKALGGGYRFSQIKDFLGDIHNPWKIISVDHRPWSELWAGSHPCGWQTGQDRGPLLPHAVVAADHFI